MRRRRGNWDIRRGRPRRRCAGRWSGFGRMATAERTWLMIAAEKREFDGILKRFGASSKIEWPTVEFACQARFGGDRWVMIANGPGARLAAKALEWKMEVSGIISTGFCGALDESLRVGQIVIGRSGTCPDGAEILSL